MKASRKSRGFTLAEIMVALSILAVIMVLISQAVSMVSATWRSGIARVDNFSQARAVLNLINRDVQNIVLRPDVAAFVDAGGAPSFAFYSQVSGTQASAANSPARRLSLVQYFRNESATPPVFQRKDSGFTYATNAAASISLNQDGTLPTGSLSAADAQTLAEGIIDFKWQTLDGKADVNPHFKYKDTVAGDLTRTRAIIVSLLVIDSNAFRSADPALLAAIRGKFSGTPAGNRTYAQYWNGILKAPGFGLDLRPGLRNAIRCFERHIPLPTATSPE